MSRPELATTLTALLELTQPPVALSVVDAKPDGVTATERVVPSSCTFWREAEKGVFFASAEQHFNCPVGSHVMGFEMPQNVQEMLGGLVQSMCDAQYLEMAEVAMIPSLGAASAAGIVYGPLSEFPLEPDIVLLWLTASQTMLVNEATGTANWTKEPATVSGRPGCTALPLAHASGEPKVSVGCIGMRTFTGVGDDRMLAAVPGAKLAEFTSALQATVESNKAMKAFYEGHKAQFV
ncbi:DUF169 domain-containing protein [Actinokineospora guangxiensis]|uniref:DUF169 domain-containing protein n=1 Tax=Actinokineospora guangxiensis TaxID=1490288 RepID=A0ABW0EQ57_9PSEU